ncbi:CD48 antigen [Camelus dromedarius]|uniref:CD48 antigen n=1 Tax=Camelus dromedarius TaxID=9838 RepID=A0A5N4CQX3_CAMDR|nr:CD48 antigen [Camelus dromedarius]
MPCSCVKIRTKATPKTCRLQFKRGFYVSEDIVIFQAEEGRWGSQTVKDPSSSCTSKRTVGGSVQLQLNSALYPNIREIEWKWDSEDDKPQLLVSWKPDASSPDWYEFEEKYKHRFSLTRMASLSIRNLTMEMSGLYIANIKFRSGKSQEEAFRLCLYEPIPDPQIQIHSSSNTSGWCNISLECEIPGSTENLTVTWLSQGLPRELEQRGPLGPAPSSRNLSLSVPLSHFNGHLTCVVSNPVDEKNTSLHLEDICPWKGESTLLPVVPASAAAPQALPTEESADLQTGEANSHDPFYEESSLLRHPKKDTEKGTCHSLSPECPLAIYTVYEKIRTSPELQEDA